MASTKLIDDVARIAGGGISFFSTIRTQIKDEVKTRVETLADRMDLVPRADLERVEEMLAETRKQLDALEKRLKKLETKKQ